MGYTMKHRISMPVIQNGTGADSYFELLAQGLTNQGHDVSLQFYPRRYEASPRFLGLSYRCPEGTQIVHTKAEHGWALRTGDVVCHLSTAPRWYAPICAALGAAGDDLYVETWTPGDGSAEIRRFNFATGKPAAAALFATIGTMRASCTISTRITACPGDCTIWYVLL